MIEAMIQIEDDQEDEGIEDVPEDEKATDELLNVRISKCIEGQLCSGAVIDVALGERTRERLYLIEYLDGDVEHMTSTEVKAGLSRWVTHNIQDEDVSIPEAVPEKADEDSIIGLLDVQMEGERTPTGDPQADAGGQEGQDEDIESLPEEEKTRDVLLYGRISKRMLGEVYTGLIVDVSVGTKTRERLYLVRYLDGDLEHMTESEAMKAVATWADADRVDERYIDPIFPRPEDFKDFKEPMPYPDP